MPVTPSEFLIDDFAVPYYADGDGLPFGIDDFAFPVVGSVVVDSGVLSAVNNGDGTVALTITDAGPGDVVTVYYTRFASDSPASSVAVATTLTIGVDGTAFGTVTLPDGAYVFTGFVGGLPYTNSVRVNLADAANYPAVAAACRAEIHARILALGLPFEDVQQQLTPDETDLDCPGLILSPFGLAESKEPGLSGTEDVGYPTQVYMIDRQNKYDHELLSMYEYWRQEIAREFDGKQLDTVVENLICRVEYDVIMNVQSNKFEYLIWQLTIRAVARMHR